MEIANKARASISPFLCAIRNSCHWQITFWTFINLKRSLIPIHSTLTQNNFCKENGVTAVNNQASRRICKPKIRWNFTNRSLYFPRVSSVSFKLQINNLIEYLTINKLHGYTSSQMTKRDSRQQATQYEYEGLATDLDRYMPSTM